MFEEPVCPCVSDVKSRKLVKRTRPFSRHNLGFVNLADLRKRDFFRGASGFEALVPEKLFAHRNETETKNCFERVLFRCANSFKRTPVGKVDYCTRTYRSELSSDSSQEIIPKDAENFLRVTQHNTSSAVEIAGFGKQLW